MKKALVTGAGGFIGGHLVKSLLDQEYSVVAVDQKWPEDWHQWHDKAINMDGISVRVFSPKLIRSADEVYHLAADMGGIGYITSHLVSCAANIVDTIHLLEQTRDGQRVFFASSACVYPMHMQVKSGPMSLKESDVWPYDPEPGYGFEKLYGEQLMQWHALERGVATRIARYHNVYGPHGDWNSGREKAPAAICRKVAEAVLTSKLGEIPHVDIWGDGEQSRSFMYVDDCVEGTQRILRSNVATPLNLGSEEWVTINELLGMVANIADCRDLSVQYQLDKPQGVRGRNSDNTMIRDLLNWEPSATLQFGLKKTYSWIYDQVKASL